MISNLKIWIAYTETKLLHFSKTTDWISFAKVSIDNFLYGEGYSMKILPKMFTALEAS